MSDPGDPVRTIRVLELTGAALIAALLSACEAREDAAAARPPQAGVERDGAGPRALRPRWRAEKDLERALAPWRDPTRIVLKLEDGAGAQAQGGRLEAQPGGKDLLAVQVLLEGFAELRVEPYVAVGAAELAELRASGEEASGWELADLSQYFLVSLAASADVRWLMERLLALPVVEEAYALPRVILAAGDIQPPATPNLTGWQIQLGSYNLPAVRNLPGGNGAGVTVTDVEAAWNLRGMFGDTSTHEDLQGLDLQSPAPAAWDPTSWVVPPGWTSDHGDAVLGLLGADVDAPGVDGLLPGAVLRVSAAHTTAGWRIADAIVRAAQAMSAGAGSGALLLIELQIGGPNSGACNPLDPLNRCCANAQFGSLPIEVLGAEFNAIRLATALGVVVVEAAGNGEQDLDDWNDGAPCMARGNSAYALFDPNLSDSGALVVGATDTIAQRAWFSNHGRRVDACALGQGLATLGYGDLFNGGIDQRYTSVFGGTSGASPLVLSAAGILQSAHRYYHGPGRYPHHALRLLLRTSGSPSASPSSDRIGEQPELQGQYKILQTGPRPALVFETQAAANANLGRSVAGLGDVDGDGYGDVIVAEPVIAVTGGQGRAHILSGATGEIWRTHLWGGTTSGTRVARAGDVDGNGFDDYLISDPLLPGGGVCVVYDGWTGVSPLYFAGSSSEKLGWSAQGVGDLNADGFDDIVMGAPGFNGGQGRVHIRHGGSGGMTLYGPIAGEATWPDFGHAVAAAGDVDGDGTPDFLASATSSLAPGKGKVYVFSGTNGNLIRSWSDAGNNGFGHALASAGDVNRDGRADVLVGLPYYSGIDATRGRAIVYSGRDGSVLHVLDGYSSNGLFGYALDGLGDVNGDRRGDFLVSAYNELGPGNVRGAVHVFDGRTGSILWSYRGEPGASVSDQFGAAAAGAGDIDGDGRNDVIVGAPQWRSAQNWGRAYTYLSPTRRNVLRYP